jgi:hypothetical protein
MCAVSDFALPNQVRALTSPFGGQHGWRRGFTSLGYLVESPRRNPWMPPPPPLTPPVVVLPDVGTLERVLEALRRL